MAKWLVCQTRNFGDLGFDALAICWIRCPEFKSSTTLVNSPLVSSYQLILFCFELLFVSYHLSGVLDKLLPRELVLQDNQLRFPLQDREFI